MTIQNKSIQKVIIFLLICINIIFLVYWMMLACNCRPHFDDIHSLWKIKEQSVLEYICKAYITWSGRFFAYLQNAIHSKLIIWFGHQWYIPIAYYCMGVTMCWACVAERFKDVSRIFLFLTILFLYNIYVLTNIDFPVFTWVCATSYYIMGPSLCLLIHYLNKVELSPIQWIVFTVITLFIGGANEAFTPIVLLVMFVNGLAIWKSHDWDVRQTWTDKRIKKMVLTAIAILALFAIVVIAPGNYARLDGIRSESEYASFSGVFSFIVGMGKAIATYLYFMVFYIPYYLIIGMLGYYCGTRSRSILVTNRNKVLRILIAAYCIYTIISVIPTVYIYGGFGIQRVYTHNVFFLVVLFSAIGFVLGNERDNPSPDIILTVCLAAFLVIMSFSLCTDTKSAMQYSQAVDERAELLETLKAEGNVETVLVKPLPHSYTTDIKWNVLKLFGKKISRPVLFYESDTDIKPNEYEAHYKRYHQLPFDFVIDPNYIGEE